MLHSLNEIIMRVKTFIDYNMHHAVAHALIGILIMAPFAVFGYPYLGATIASAFYGGREVYQFYVLKKTHCDWTGCFDHVGWVPVLVVTMTIAFILDYILN